VSIFQTRPLAHYAIDDAAAEFKQVMEDNGVPVRITEIFRTKVRQEKLYAQGRTAPGPKVTWTLASEHTRHRAFDFTIVDAPNYDDWPDAWEFAGEVIRGMGLVWGGEWSVADFGHAELSVAESTTV